MSPKEQKERLLEEIKRIERDLYQKRSELSLEEMDAPDSLSDDALKKAGTDGGWLADLIGLVGINSIGGDSVQDVRAERRG